MFWKYKYWKNGICSRDYWNEYTKDIKDIIDIDNAIEEKGLREKKIKEMMSRIKW